MFNHKRLSFLITILVAMAGADLCQAASTVTISAKVFPSNAVLFSVGPFSTTGSIPLKAEMIAGYEFLFWNLNASLQTNPDPSYPPPADSTVFATAWYVAVGGGPCTKPPCTGVTTWAFSLNSDKIIPNTPIASVTPSTAWSGPPSTTVSTTAGSVVITAQPEIVPYGKFSSWLELPATSQKGENLAVAANGAVDAIAFYGFPEPNPCEALCQPVYCIPDLPPAVCQELRKVSALKCSLCLSQYGEGPPVTPAAK
jgi:hypothetical protein